jgi:hypothetical protein
MWVLIMEGSFTAALAVRANVKSTKNRYNWIERMIAMAIIFKDFRSLS